MLKMRLLVTFIMVGVLLLPTACNDMTSNRLEPTETVTSPKQISDWLGDLAFIFNQTGVSGHEASRVLAYGSIAYYEGYSMNYPAMRSLVGQLNGFSARPEPDGELAYNFGVVSESALRYVVLQLLTELPSNFVTILNSTYVLHERDYLLSGWEQDVVDRSREFGEILGEAIVAWAEEDGFDQLVNCSVEPPIGSNNWQPTPPDYQDAANGCWGNLRAFTFTEQQLVALCNPRIPDEVSNEPASSYYADVVESEELINNLNPAQEQIADFWFDSEATYTPSVHYASILRQLVDRNILNAQQTVTAFAQLSIAIADTYISTFKLKYTYFRPRPVTVIRENLNAQWQPYLKTPATPEYPSLCATLGYAAAQVFIHRYGDREFTDNSFVEFGLDERIFSSFTEMAQEASLSRLYAGTNFRTTVENSETHGRCIAQRANELFLTE